MPLPQKLTSLRRKTDIRVVYRGGRKYATHSFFVWIFKNKLTTNRILITCPKAVDKRSSHRNRIRRRIRELLRKNLRSKEKIDIIIRVLPERNAIETTQIKRELDHVFDFS